MQPKKVRVWIDARKEKIKAGEIKELKYEIEDLQNQNLLQSIYQAIGYCVISLAIDDNKLLVTYETNKVSPSFIDFLLAQRSINFRRND